MNSKRFSVFALSVLALVFVMGMASADIVFTGVTGNGASVNQGNTATVTFQLFENATGGGAASGITFNTPITLTSGTNTFSSSSTITGVITTLAQDATSTVMSLSFSVPSNQSAGTYTGTLQPSGTYTATFSPLIITLTVISAPSEITTCTNTGNPGSLKIKKIDFTNNGLSSGTTFGEDDKWFPFEQIEAEVQIKNDGNDNIDNIELDWGIYDTKNNQWVIEMDNLKDFDLKDGDTKTFTIPFTIDDGMDVDLSDLSDGEHYKLYVTATGDVDNDTAPSTCATDFEPASVVIESDFVILNNIQMPETIECGQTIEGTADVWNIGDNDQDSVSVEIAGRESVLNLDQSIDAGDINAFDKQEISFSLIIPKSLEEKTYGINFAVKDEDSDTYKNDFNDDYSEFTLPLKVSGACSLESQISVVANTVSGGQEGQKLVVQATITNNANEQKTYTLSTAGFEDWASASSIDQSNLVLNAGESKTVTVTLNVNKNTAGNQVFFLVMSSGTEVLRQPVNVSIEQSKGIFGITGNAISGNNWYIWGIGLLNLILVIVIIIVAVRIARK
jgi:hypothetical protein